MHRRKTALAVGTIIAGYGMATDTADAQDKKDRFVIASHMGPRTPTRSDSNFPSQRSKRNSPTSTPSICRPASTILRSTFS